MFAKIRQLAGVPLSCFRQLITNNQGQKREYGDPGQAEEYCARDSSLDFRRHRRESTPS